MPSTRGTAGRLIHTGAISLGSRGSGTHERKSAPRLPRRLGRRWPTLPNTGGGVAVPPDDAVPGVALTRVPVDLRPRTSTTGLGVQPGLLVFRATGVGPTRAGRYRPVLCQQAGCLRHRAGLGLCATQREPHSGHCDAARQQGRTNNIPPGPGVVHSIVLSLLSGIQRRKLAKVLRFLLGYRSQKGARGRCSVSAKGVTPRRGPARPTYASRAARR
jgi:hypothetical protein